MILIMAGESLELSLPLTKVTGDMNVSQQGQLLAETLYKLTDNTTRLTDLFIHLLCCWVWY